MTLKAMNGTGAFASEPSPRSGIQSSVRQVNLLRGWPSPALLPPKLVLQGAQAVLSQSYDVPSEAGHSRPSRSPSRPIDYGSLLPAEKALEYGPDPGHAPLRKALGEWFQDFYGPATKRAYPSAVQKLTTGSDGAQDQNSEFRQKPSYRIPMNRIALTGGASQSLGVILNALTDPTYTRKIWIIAPAYFLAFNIFQDAGFGAFNRMAAVPELPHKEEEDEDESSRKRGPDVPWLRDALETCERDWASNGGANEPQLKPHPIYKKIFKHVIYTVPSFSNPTSVTTSLSVREELVRCARDFDALIVCDDVYDMLQWPARTETAEATSSSSQNQGDGDMSIAPLPRLVDIDRCIDLSSESATSDGVQYGNVVSNGTFSKIVGPGCRVGWIEGTPDLAFAISQAGTTKSGGSAGHMVSMFLTEAVENGSLETHIRKVLRPAYEERWRVLVRAIEDQLVPLGVRIHYPHGRKTGRRVSQNNKEKTETPRAGGYFIWLTLPDSMSSAEVTKRCLDEQSLVVAGGSMFQVPRNSQEENKFDRNIRLCFSFEDLPELKEGVSRLARVMQAMLAESTGSSRAKPHLDDETLVSKYA